MKSNSNNLVRTFPSLPRSYKEQLLPSKLFSLFLKFLEICQRWLEILLRWCVNRLLTRLWKRQDNSLQIWTNRSLTSSTQANCWTWKKSLSCLCPGRANLSNALWMKIIVSNIRTPELSCTTKMEITCSLAKRRKCTILTGDSLSNDIHFIFITSNIWI